MEKLGTIQLVEADGQTLVAPASIAKQDAIIAQLDGVVDVLTAVLAELGAKLEPGQAIGVANFPVTQPISGSVAVSNQPTQPLTDTQLRASAVPVSLASVPSHAVTGPLTDAQLRASAIKAREDLAPMTWVSLKSAAPAASAVQADTGALAAGDYDFDIALLASDAVAVGKGLIVEHRNAANGATLQTVGGIPGGGQLVLSLRRYTIALNERIRVIAGTAAGAASSMYLSAIGRRLA